MTESTREFDLVLFGATGFTGRLVAEHLVAHARPGLRLGLAGRRKGALEALRERLVAAAQPGRVELDVVVADVTDAASMAQMAARSRAVLSTVGPFVDYGEPVVRACVAEGTDYLDSTGERPFVLAMIERYHAAAQERGVRLVFSCGFDCIPADLGVLYTVEQLPAGRPIDISSFLAFRGSFSGGTERSGLKELAAKPPGDEAYVLRTAEREARVDKGGMHRAPEVRAWVTPYRDAVDSNIVLRSAMALSRYGPSFSYTPWVVHTGLSAMLLLTAVVATVSRLARVRLLRALLLKLVKPSGTGPTPEQRAAGWFRLQLDGRSDAARVSVEVSGGDPGYGATSIMLGQSALCLLEDRAELPVCSGVVTTAQALGNSLIARLQEHGIHFRVQSRMAS